jgi:hypothetical protein
LRSGARFLERLLHEIDLAVSGLVHAVARE